jgi:hypothetical protein
VPTALTATEAAIARAQGGGQVENGAIVGVEVEEERATIRFPV